MSGLAALLPVLFAGYGILALMRRSGSIADCFRILPFAFGAGVGVLYLFFLWASWFGEVSLTSGYILLVSVGLLGGWRWRAGGVEPARQGDRWTPVECLLLTLLLALLATGVLLSVSLPLLEWDTRILWGVKAKILTAEATLSGEAFRDPYRLHIHPRYPLLVPFLSSWMARHQGGFQEIHFQGLICVFALLTTIQLFVLLRKIVSRALTLLLLLGLALTGAWLTAEFGSCVEIALTFFLVLAVQGFFLWLDRQNTSDLVMTGFFLFCAAMTKNEGLLLIVSSCLALFIVVLWEKGWKAGIYYSSIVAGVSVILSTGWFMHLAQIPAVSDENYFMRFTLATLREGILRLPLIFSSILERVVDLKQWHLFWIAPLLAGVRNLAIRPRFDQRFWFVCLVMVLYIAGIVLIYVVSPWRDITLHVAVSFDRVMLPLLPLVLIVLAVNCAAVSAKKT